MGIFGGWSRTVYAFGWLRNASQTTGIEPFHQQVLLTTRESRGAVIARPSYRWNHCGEIVASSQWEEGLGSKWSVGVSMDRQGWRNSEIEKRSVSDCRKYADVVPQQENGT